MRCNVMMAPPVLAYEMADITHRILAEGVVLIAYRAHLTRAGATGPDEMFVPRSGVGAGAGVAKLLFDGLPGAALKS